MADTTKTIPFPQEEGSITYSVQSDVCVSKIWIKLRDCELEKARFQGQLDNAKLQQENKDLKVINELEKSLKDAEAKIADFQKNKPKSLEIQQKDKEITALNNTIKQLNKEKDLKGDTIKSLKDEISTLNTEKEGLNTQINTLDKQVNDWKNKFWEPQCLIPIMSVLIVLIIAITLISLKRGLTFTKGNTSICLGEKKKTRTKKAD